MDDGELTRLRGHSIRFVLQYHNLITAFAAVEDVMMPMLGAAEFPNGAMRTTAAALVADDGGLAAWQAASAGASAAACSRTVRTDPVCDDSCAAACG